MKIGICSEENLNVCYIYKPFYPSYLFLSDITDLHTREATGIS